MDERWITRRTTHRLEGGREVPTYDVVVDMEDGSLGAIVARVHGIDVGRLADVERRARVLAAGPDLIEALKRALAAWKLEADEGDGIEEGHLETYQYGRALLSQVEG